MVFVNQNDGNGHQLPSGQKVQERAAVDLYAGLHAAEHVELPRGVLARGNQVETSRCVVHADHMDQAHATTDALLLPWRDLDSAYVGGALHQSVFHDHHFPLVWALPKLESHGCCSV